PTAKSPGFVKTEPISEHDGVVRQRHESASGFWVDSERTSLEAEAPRTPALGRWISRSDVTILTPQNKNAGGAARGRRAASRDQAGVPMPMRIPMHRYEYTKLTREQIGRALAATENGPTSASPFSNVLTGRNLKIVTQDGPVLEYAFGNNRRLTLSENGGKRVSAGYGELTLNKIVFFSHMIPGEQKGYNVFIDQDTNLATVFEVWFSSGRTERTMGGNTITVDDREVQRQIYFGYVDNGQEPPENLHHYTNRICGKGLYWKQDTGIETLELYASVANTNFVELTRHADQLSWVAPSDYVLVDDRHFLYDRTECELSGIHTCFAADLYDLRQVGVRRVFIEREAREYYRLRGAGRVVGQHAYLEPLDEHGKVPMGAASAGGQPPAKGARVAYRPVRTFRKMTDEEVHEAAERRTVTFGVAGSEDVAPQVAMSGNNLPFSDILVGKTFTVRLDDGPAREIGRAHV